MKYSRQILKKLFSIMVRIRRFEEKIVELYPQQQMRCPVHLYIGQEAVAAGVCVNLKKGDIVFSNHRSHGHYLAQQADARLLMAEIYGRETGCSRGKGGSMHIVAKEKNFFGTSSIVAGGIPIACGAALAQVFKKKRNVSVAFFGDGAVDAGVFYESLSLASLKRLPIVFVCENNFYATHSHILARQYKDNIYQRGLPLAIPGIRVDGNQVLEVFQAAKVAIDRARTGKGPTLIECRTYRWMGHVTPALDTHFGYRTKEEVDWWLRRCPVKRFRQFLLKKRVLSLKEIEQIEQRIDREVEEAVGFSKRSPYPGKEQLYQDVLA